MLTIQTNSVIIESKEGVVLGLAQVSGSLKWKCLPIK
nr:MAG TPA: hypothetical protein [Caudoviricetes sp.]